VHVEQAVDFFQQVCMLMFVKRYVKLQILVALA